MQTVPTIGLDITKSVFQVHGIDAEGKVLISRQLKRRFVLAFLEKLQPCLVGIEACATSHHWSRELKALGHNVRLMPPSYVKPYVKRLKNDATDAEAICEAVTRAIAVCRDQNGRAAELLDAASHPPALHSPADLGTSRLGSGSCPSSTRGARSFTICSRSKWCYVPLRFWHSSDTRGGLLAFSRHTRPRTAYVAD